MMVRLVLLVLLSLAACGGEAPPPSRTRAPATPMHQAPAPLVDEVPPDSNVAQARAALIREGLAFDLILVSHASTGVQAEIYKDLVKRNIRATVGPDEGYDTYAVPCHPDCVFVTAAAVDSVDVGTWTAVLYHEQRHMVQSRNNPDMARQVREPNGRFTSYAAFLEACADEGIYVAENIYHASERMPRLRGTLGPANAAVLARACAGFPDAYRDIVNAYESKSGGRGSFSALFPPYS